MKLVSIDLETTGRNYGQHPGYRSQILEFAAVCFDPQPNIQERAENLALKQDRPSSFEGLVHQEVITGEPYALQMNQEILQEIARVKETYRTIYPNECALVAKFGHWLYDQGFDNDNPATVVGKNFAKFDDRFLENVPGWLDLPIDRRILDVASLVFNPRDGRLRNLKDCLEVVGIRKSVSHRAIDDALDVMSVVTRFFAG